MVVPAPGAQVAQIAFEPVMLTTGKAFTVIVPVTFYVVQGPPVKVTV